MSKLSTNLVFFRFPKPNILPRLVYSVRCKRIFSCMGWSSRYRTRELFPSPKLHRQLAGSVRLSLYIPSMVMTNIFKLEKKIIIRRANYRVHTPRNREEGGRDSRIQHPTRGQFFIPTLLKIFSGFAQHINMQHKLYDFALEFNVA